MQTIFKMVRPLIVIALLGIQLSFQEVEALNKECMKEMGVMMEKQTKLIVPCVESLGLTTPAEKKEKALVLNRFNFTFNHEDIIMLQFFLPVPLLLRGIFHVESKFTRFKEVVTYFLQCIMKCVMVKGEMLAPDGSVDMDLAQKMLENLPDSLKEKAEDVIGECGHHAAAMDPGEASCESYREFVSCMLDVALKVRTEFQNVQHLIY